MEYYLFDIEEYTLDEVRKKNGEENMPPLRALGKAPLQQIDVLLRRASKQKDGMRNA